VREKERDRERERWREAGRDGEGEGKSENKRERAIFSHFLFSSLLSVFKVPLPMCCCGNYISCITS
jgi:hypothetical protein